MAIPHATSIHEAVDKAKAGPLHSAKLASRSLVFLIILGAAALRFVFLARKPFWFDECFSAGVARLNWSGFLHLLWWREANMSLYYLLLRGWLHFGDGPFFIRSLSVLLSLATLPAIYWLGKKLFAPRVGIVAVALISCNAYSVRYAQEARSYSLFLLLATLASAFFVSGVREPSPQNRQRYALTAALAVYAHFYALLLIASHAFSLAVRGRKPDEKEIRLSLRKTWLAIGVAVIPILLFVAKTGAGPIRWISRPGALDLFEFFEHLSGNAGLPLLLLYVAMGLAAVLPLKGRLLKSSADSEVWRIQFLLTWLLLPIVLCMLLSLVRPVFLGRYFIFCLPALILLASAGLANLSKTWMLAVCLAAMLFFSIRGTLSYYDHDFDLQRDDSQAAANYIYDHAQARDAVMFHIAEARIPYEFFVRLREEGSPAGGNHEPDIVFPRHGDRLDYRDVVGNPTNEFLRSLGGKYTRVWVVLMSNQTAGKPDAATLTIEQTLGGSFSQARQLNFSQTEVWLYSK